MRLRFFPQGIDELSPLMFSFGMGWSVRHRIGCEHLCDYPIDLYLKGNRAQRFFTNARGGIRTRTAFAIRPSNVRVYQFHHPGMDK